MLREAVARGAAWGALLAIHLALPPVLARMHADIADEDAYRALGAALADRGSFALEEGSFHHRPGAPNTYFAPGWPLVLAGGRLLGGSEAGPWAALGLSWCLALIAADRLARALGLPDRARWALLLWLTLDPIYLYYHGHLMTEPLAVAMGLAILAVGVRFASGARWTDLAALGVLSGLGHLVRTALVLPVLASWLVASATVPWRRLVPRAVVFAALHLAVVGPWLARMERVGAGGLATELKLGHNLYCYNNIYVENPYRPRPGDSYRFPEGLEDLSPSERDGRLLRLALGGIVRRPDLYLRNCLRRVAYLLSPLPQFRDASPAEAAALAAATVAFVWAPWALVLAVLSRRRGPRTRGEWVVLAAIALWYAAHVLVHASIRQRLPSDPWVAALALALVSWSPRRAASSPGETLLS